MIDAINNALGSSLPTTGSSSKDGNGAFDAALLATQRAAQRQQQHDSEMDSIKSKGFTAWARDTQIEALKEKLRQQIMSEMGLDEDSLGRLSAAVRQILEQKIQEEVDRRMQEEMAKQQDGNKDGKDAKDSKDGNSSTAVTAAPATATVASTTQQTGKKDQDGISCPVIPALSWPGAASLL